MGWVGCLAKSTCCFNPADLTAGQPRPTSSGQPDTLGWPFSSPAEPHRRVRSRWVQPESARCNSGNRRSSTLARTQRTEPVHRKGPTQRDELQPVCTDGNPSWPRVARLRGPCTPWKSKRGGDAAWARRAQSTCSDVDGLARTQALWLVC